MFRRIYQLLPVAAGILGVATTWADAGYLPQAGPVPLRFRAAAPPAVEQAIAPILVLPPPPIPYGPPERPQAPAETVLPITAVTNGPPVEYDARDPVTGPSPPSAPEVVVSPQMLIKYFTGPTNAATNAAPLGKMTPFGFTPPQATTPAPAPPASNNGTNAAPH